MLFRSVKDPKETGVLDEVQWLIQQLICTAILSNNRYLQLGTDMTKPLWRKTLLALAGTDAAAGTAGEEPAPPGPALPNPDAALTLFVHHLQHDNLFYALWHVLREYGYSVELLHRLARHKKCPRRKLISPNLAVCVQDAYEMLKCTQPYADFACCRCHVKTLQITDRHGHKPSTNLFTCVSPVSFPVYAYVRNTCTQWRFNVACSPP